MFKHRLNSATDSLSVESEESSLNQYSVSCTVVDERYRGAGPRGRASHHEGSFQCGVQRLRRSHNLRTQLHRALPPGHTQSSIPLRSAPSTAQHHQRGNLHPGPQFILPRYPMHHSATMVKRQRGGTCTSHSNVSPGFRSIPRGHNNHFSQRGEIHRDRRLVAKFQCQQPQSATSVAVVITMPSPTPAPCSSAPAFLPSPLIGMIITSKPPVNVCEDVLDALF